MKKLSFLIVLFFISLTISCSNYQSSPKESALYVVEHIEDFQEIIQYVAINSYGFLPILLDPYVAKNTEIKKGNGIQFVHQIVYKTKDGGYKLIFLSDDSPPKIVLTLTIK